MSCMMTNPFGWIETATFTWAWFETAIADPRGPLPLEEAGYCSGPTSGSESYPNIAYVTCASDFMSVSHCILVYKLWQLLGLHEIQWHFLASDQVGALGRMGLRCSLCALSGSEGALVVWPLSRSLERRPRHHLPRDVVIVSWVHAIVYSLIKHLWRFYCIQVQCSGCWAQCRSTYCHLNPSFCQRGQAFVPYSEGPLFYLGPHRFTQQMHVEHLLCARLQVRALEGPSNVPGVQSLWLKRLPVVTSRAVRGLFVFSRGSPCSPSFTFIPIPMEATQGVLPHVHLLVFWHSSIERLSLALHPLSLGLCLLWPVECSGSNPVPVPNRGLSWPWQSCCLPCGWQSMAQCLPAWQLPALAYVCWMSEWLSHLISK